ncbi:hypothetical protein FH972_023785 [Carpinus fangiana]|uniref:histidinol-phosphatase n=1 Tax=Carpinus fangiana TaxID=176857 RepID=A0A5N6KW75_9ROSI|nr:hypothetical protein FH972_023785 [Carpinus fangiana]
MPFSHHSHSGEFCGHAANTLAEVVEHAVQRRKMSTFALTEHCPRGDDDLYPEEAAQHNAASLAALFDAFIVEAVRLQQQVHAASSAPGAAQCEILIGFEAEWIRPAASTAIAQKLLAQHGGTIDFFIGSVHHVGTVPIDFDRALYERARRMCGGSDAALFAAYFDAQLEMLEALRPRVVGHFDLIRLFADAPDEDLRAAAGGALWPKVLRNLSAARGMGALLELNTSALRKGLAQPYPRLEICRAWMAIGGQFVLSDDSHGIAQDVADTSRPKAARFNLQLPQLESRLSLAVPPPKAAVWDAQNCKTPVDRDKADDE